jgi:type IV secretory pathway TrbD component
VSAPAKTRFTDAAGEVPTNVSLLRGDYHLIMGCDAQKIYDVLTIALLCIFAVPVLWAKIFGVLLFPIVIPKLLQIARRCGPWFFLVYERSIRFQPAYKRSAWNGAPLTPYPDQQRF